MRDVKEVVGILMRVLGGAEITEVEVLDLEFEADDELQEVLNETFVKLLEFVNDSSLRGADRELDQKYRAALQDVLNKIVALSDAGPSSARTRAS
jgi:hypothetical protein